MNDLLASGWQILPAPLRRTLEGLGVTALARRWARRNRPYEPDVCHAIERLVRPGSVCADVGANVGAITQVLARMVGPGGQVIAFEAHPANAEVLRRNVDADGSTARVRVENIAVADGSRDRLQLFPRRGHRAAEWNIVGHDVEGNQTEPELEVAAASLDGYFPPGERLDLVKIDVEGAEGLVLVGMRRLLREARPIVVVEFHDEAGWAGRAELFAADYHLYDLAGRRLAPVQDGHRVYHCLALPQESDRATG